jgi:hypothetical protein
MAASPAPSLPSKDIQRFIKMRGALDDRLVIGFLSGRYNGVVDGDVTPLFGVFAATFSRYRPKADGYEVVAFEQAYFTDLDTGRWLDRWTNPYTGEAVKVPVTSSPPTKLFIGPDLRFHGAPLPPSVKLDMGASAAEVIGDEIFFVEHVYASQAAHGQTPHFSYNENTTLRAKLADVDRTGAGTIPCQTSFDAVVGWRPWLNMGDRPGFMSAYGHGGYGARLDTLPKPWLDATAALRPELLAHPEAILDPVWRS